MKKYSMGNGRFAIRDAGASDLERGYSTDTGDIPDDGENVFHPESARRKRDELKWRMEYMDEDDKEFGEGGFLDRNCNGHDRY